VPTANANLREGAQGQDDHECSRSSTLPVTLLSLMRADIFQAEPGQIIIPNTAAAHACSKFTLVGLSVVLYLQIDTVLRFSVAEVTLLLLLVHTVN
jgi:hypothetical protein